MLSAFMQRGNLDDDLVAFLAVGRERSFTKAAARLGMSHAPMFRHCPVMRLVSKICMDLSDFANNPRSANGRYRVLMAQAPDYICRRQAVTVEWSAPREWTV